MRITYFKREILQIMSYMFYVKISSHLRAQHDPRTNNNKKFKKKILMGVREQEEVFLRLFASLLRKCLKMC